MDQLPIRRLGQNMEAGRLQQLQNYQFYQIKPTQTDEEIMKEDFVFVVGFCPPEIQERVRTYNILETGFGHLISSILGRLREDVGTATKPATIDVVRDEHGVFIQDTSSVEYKRVLLERFTEFARIYNFLE